MNKAESEAAGRWMSTQHRCAVCWWPKNDSRRATELHHICGGAARSKGHDARNYLLLCERCHGIHHSGKIYGLSPDLSVAMLLSAKLESDPANYDPEYLAYLRNRKHLGFDPAKVPDYYVTERKANERPWTEREPWPK